MSTRAAARGAAAPARSARPQPRPDTRPRPRPRPRAVPRSRRRTGVRLGPLVIPIIALVLGGIVWVNVAKLALTNDTGKVMERSRAVEAQTARLQSQLDRLDARVRENAMKRLGMVMPSGDSVTYLDPLAHP
ncbi:MAG TPA: hypothetical protein VL422_11990 [Miltoncostaea sp.]|nr:hypothetical protein [Miltoncostaea sp.]